MTFTLCILTQPLGRTQLQRPADHMLTPSPSPEYEVAEREWNIPVMTIDSFALWPHSVDSRHKRTAAY